MQFKKILGLGLGLGSVGAFAQGADPYATITAAANWSSVATDGVAIAVLLAAVYVVFRGSKLLVGFIRR